MRCGQSVFQWTIRVYAVNSLPYSGMRGMGQRTISRLQLIPAMHVLRVFLWSIRGVFVMSSLDTERTQPRYLDPALIAIAAVLIVAIGYVAFL
jgi:hypothetical protein